MGDWKLPRDGGCRCGALRFRVTAPPLLTMACHCTGCQRMTGAPYALSAAIATAGFAIIQGEPVIGGLRAAGGHNFCPHCMSWVFTRPAALDFFVNIRPTMLDDPSDFAPFLETYTSEKLAWVTTSAPHSFAKFPSMEAFEALMDAYAARPMN